MGSDATTIVDLIEAGPLEWKLKNEGMITRLRRRPWGTLWGRQYLHAGLLSSPVSLYSPRTKTEIAPDPEWSVDQLFDVSGNARPFGWIKSLPGCDGNDPGILVGECDLAGLPGQWEVQCPRVVPIILAGPANSLIEKETEVV